MKKSVGSFVALNRKAFLLLGVMLTVAVFGVVAWRTGAAPQANDSFGVSQAERKPVLTKKTELTRPGDQEKQPTGVISGASYKNDTSPPLRDMKPVPYDGDKEDHEASQNPKIPHPAHIDVPDPVVEDKLSAVQNLFFPTIPLPTLNFDGIAFPGVNCNCAPPDTNGEVGLTQYVQMVNKGYQVYNKSTGASVFGPVDLFTIWAGFGGACENGGSGDPIVLYDQIANRWIISQFATAAGGTPITDECIAVSTSNDATGSFNRYGFHLGTNFFDYPHIAVWPDGYYMSDNVFNAAGTVYLGPQPFAFDRTRMLAGLSATFLTTPALGNTDPILPADLDGSILPTAGAPETFVGYPGQATPCILTIRC